MMARLEKTQNGYVIPLTEEMVKTLQLREGGTVEVLATSPKFRYATVEEALQAFEDTLPENDEVYRELAK